VLIGVPKQIHQLSSISGGRLSALLTPDKIESTRSSEIDGGARGSNLKHPEETNFHISLDAIFFHHFDLIIKKVKGFFAAHSPFSQNSFSQQN
jgi:hypothetical protein